MNTLDELKVGKRAVIAEFSNQEVGCKLMTMGILPGSEVQVIRKSPFGGAIYLKILHQQFAVRNNEAACIVLK